MIEAFVPRFIFESREFNEELRLILFDSPIEQKAARKEGRARQREKLTDT